MKYEGFYLPGQIGVNIQTKQLHFKNHDREVAIEVPVLTSENIIMITSHLKKQRELFLKNIRTNDVIEIINQAVTKWLDPSYRLRQTAEEVLPIITGYDAEMIRLFLTSYLRSFRKANLQRMIDEDFANPLVLDEFRPKTGGGLTRAYGPELTTHIFSGNVPALPLWSIVSSLLVKSATLGKVSSSEPFFPTLFAKTIEEISPEIASTLAVVWWKGGSDELEQAAFQQSQAIVAYGGNDTIRELTKKVPAHARLLSHGHKVSFGVITNECLTGGLAWQTAQLAARDVSSFDQQGCLSPHVFYVEKGGKQTPREFAQMLAHEMHNYQHKMPRAKLSTAEKNAIVHIRTNIEFQSFTNRTTELHASADTAWTVIYEEQPTDFPFSVLNRVVTVVPIDGLRELPEKLTGIRDVMQTAGVACPPQKFEQLIELLGESGINRISFLGEMSLPEPGWHHDGRFHLADLVTWCDVESTVESKMFDYDPNRL